MKKKKNVMSQEERFQAYLAAKKAKKKKKKNKSFLSHFKRLFWF